jgi:hypothetical protein
MRINERGFLKQRPCSVQKRGIGSLHACMGRESRLFQRHTRKAVGDQRWNLHALKSRQGTRTSEKISSRYHALSSSAPGEYIGTEHNLTLVAIAERIWMSKRTGAYG